MTLRISSFVSIVFAVALMSGGATGATLNMVVEEDQTLTEDSLVFGVAFDGNYYSVIVQDGVLKKVELGGLETPEFVVETNVSEIKEFASKYSELSWLDKAKYLIQNFGVPTHVVIEYAGEKAVGLVG